MKVAVIGVGQTAYGEHWSKSLSDLLAQAQWVALDDAGLIPGQVDAVFTANMASSMLAGQGNLGVVAANLLGISVPNFAVEGACAAGALALRAGQAAIASGQADIVVVSGVEKLTDFDRSPVTAALAGASSAMVEGLAGATFPALFALVARAYMHHWGTDRRQLAAVSVKNHRHGAANPGAHLRKEVTMDQVLGSPMIADPLSLLDCAPISDGAACVILGTEAVARRLGKPLITLAGYGQGCDTLSLNHRENLIGFRATREAAAGAFAMARLTPEDVDVIELHDAFTMAELMALEDMGFFKPGNAGQATLDNQTTFGGRWVVNPSGGLKAKGHPVGATGVGQMVEIVQQLRGQCGKRQVSNARVGLTHCMGGLGATAVVHVMVREESL